MDVFHVVILRLFKLFLNTLYFFFLKIIHFQQILNIDIKFSLFFKQLLMRSFKLTNLSMILISLLFLFFIFLTDLQLQHVLFVFDLQLLFLEELVRRLGILQLALAGKQFLLQDVNDDGGG